MNRTDYNTNILNFGINNMTNEKFPEDILKILGLGLKFIPTPPNSLDGIQEGVNKYVRNLALRSHFGNKQEKNYVVKKFQTTSNWLPNDVPLYIQTQLDNIRSDTNLHLDETDEILAWDGNKRLHKKTRFSIAPIFPGFGYPKVQSNINLTSLKDTIKVLRDPKFIIKPADKNLGLTIMYDQWYCLETMRQLHDKDTYFEYTEDESKIKEDIIRNQLKAMIPFRGLEKSTEKMLKKDISDTHTLPEFYILPKLHKHPILGRPIVPSHSWLTSNASRILNYYMQPILEEYPQIINNSTTLVLKIQNLDPKRRYRYATGDVSSLYTNIPTREGITAVGSMIKDFYRNDTLLTYDLTRLLSWVLTGNLFKFRTKYFLQKNGTAMGTSCAPTYANLYMAYLERKIKITSALIWVRYIDDILLVYDKNDMEMTAVKAQYNAQHKDITINWKEDKKIHFLDILIHQQLQTGEMILSTYNKETCKFLYIPYNSFHPNSQKKAFIKTELIRFLRTNTRKMDYVERKSLFFYHLLDRGYPPMFLVPIFKAHTYDKRSKYLDIKVKDFTRLKNQQRSSSPDFNKELRILYGTVYEDGQRMNIIIPSNPLNKYVNWKGILHTEEFTKLGIIEQAPRIVKRAGKSILDFVNKANKVKSLTNGIYTPTIDITSSPPPEPSEQANTSKIRYYDLTQDDEAEDTQNVKRTKGI